MLVKLFLKVSKAKAVLLGVAFDSLRLVAEILCLFVDTNLIRYGLLFLVAHTEFIELFCLGRENVGA
jgi:hypothetical protein